MKASVHHVGYGMIEYRESFWTGNRELTVDGQKLMKKTKNEFILNGENGALACRVKGNALTGATLYVDEDVIPLVAPCKWYEIACSVLIAAFLMVWGNVPALCEVFPLIGGALGGAIAGAACVANLFLMRKVKRIGLKLLIWLGMFFGTVLPCFVIAEMIIVFARLAGL